MGHHLFTYGTLQVPQIFYHVTGRHFQTDQAVLENYACFWVRGEVYPGIRPFFAARTPGKLYFNVDLPTLKRLDDFEGDYYKRTAVRVRLHNGLSVTSHVYLIRPTYYPILSSRPWYLRDFTAQKQKHFLNAYPYMP